MRRTLSVGTALSIVALLLTSCSTTPPKPLRSSANFQPSAMDTVYILPVVDARADKKLALNLKGLQRTVERNFSGKGYKTVFVEEDNFIRGLEDLKELDANQIPKVGPSQARWMAVLAVGELSKKLTFGSTGNAEVQLAIIDKQGPAIVWEDKALGQAGQGGLIGMLMVSMMDNEAMAQAVGQVLRKIPKKQKLTS